MIESRPVVIERIANDRAQVSGRVRHGFANAPINPVGAGLGDLLYLRSAIRTDEARNMRLHSEPVSLRSIDLELYVVCGWH